MTEQIRTRVNIRMDPSLYDFYLGVSQKLNIPRNYLMLVALTQFKEKYSNINVTDKGLLNYLDQLTKDTV